MRISVITVNFNNRDGLKRTIQSVLGQTLRSVIQFIVIDGGSTDGSYDVLMEYKDHLDYWVSEPDKGIYNAMNKAIAVADGDYCNFMNSGDCYHTLDVIEKIVCLNPTEEILYGNTYTVEKNSWHLCAPKSITMSTLFTQTMNHQSTFISTKLMKKYGYDESYKIVADRKFLVQTLILDNCSYRPLDIDVTDYDIGGLSSQNPYESKAEYQRVLEELLPPRIRFDYGKMSKGALYGDSQYERFFLELKNRKYRFVIYTCSVIYIRIINLFKESAGFIKNYPLKLKD